MAFVGAAALALATAVGSTSTAVAASNTGKIVYHVGPHKLIPATGIADNPPGFPTPAQCIATYGLACYTPDEIRAAYDIPADSTGAGKKIAIIDAYGSPTVQSDLDTFSAIMNIPSTTVHTYCPSGCPKTLTAHKGGPVGWAEETSLDVQWAHAIAPDATINLIVASNNYGNVLNNAVRYAIDNNLGDVISMSYGASEGDIPGRANNVQLLQSEKLFKEAAAKGISVFASAGDNGTEGGAGYPASSPNVTAVGGTNLFTTLDGSGTYVGETVWGDAANCPLGCTIGPIGATGGAPSRIFSAPSYQQGVTGYSTRTTSDVSYNASVYTAAMVYLGFLGDNSGLYFFGGTSSGSPQWAAIGAIADQAAGHRLGFLNPTLYSLYGTPRYGNDFHDVTSGNNAWDGVPGFDGGTGYDLPTGLGSPDVANLLSDLVS
jgi:subtilase family serine protease